MLLLIKSYTAFAPIYFEVNQNGTSYNHLRCYLSYHCSCKFTILENVNELEFNHLECRWNQPRLVWESNFSFQSDLKCMTLTSRSWVLSETEPKRKKRIVNVIFFFFFFCRVKVKYYTKLQKECKVIYPKYYKNSNEYCRFFVLGRLDH